MSNSTSQRETFAGRKAFIFAAIGSAVGLGNIWRFPYVTYENGGGAFIIPYIVALLTAGIPLLFLDYAIGHKHRGSAPLSFRRLNPKFETFGWWQMMINVIIGLYYAVVLGWAASYTYFSFSSAWGADPASFFFADYLKMADGVSLSLDFVGDVAGPLIFVWIAIITILALGVQKGIAKFSGIFMPLLIIMFIALVVIALTLPGAEKGLDALFTPDWSKLKNPDVWISAYGQIFYSLSICFGIMITYSSYLKKETDLTGSGLVVGFANSSFELLAGIGVFAALGFMAVASNQAVGDVAKSGIGLAFIAFPTIIDQAGTFGTIIGILFFGSLVFAGLTSLMSVLEVIIAAVQDKLRMRRVPATVLVGLPMALVSTILFGTTTGLPVLDVMDNFVNKFGILAVAFVSVIAIAKSGVLPKLAEHLNETSSFKLGKAWVLVLTFLIPIVLGVMLGLDGWKTLTEGYGGYPTWFVMLFGWGMAIGLVVVGYILAQLPWKNRDHFEEK